MHTCTPMQGPGAHGASTCGPPAPPMTQNRCSSTEDWMPCTARQAAPESTSKLWIALQQNTSPLPHTRTPWVLPSSPKPKPSTSHPHPVGAAEQEPTTEAWWVAPEATGGHWLDRLAQRCGGTQRRPWSPQHLQQHFQSKPPITAKRLCGLGALTPPKGVRAHQ